MFQFKINHDIIYTKDKLKKANLIADDARHLCKKRKAYNQTYVSYAVSFFKWV